MKTYRVKQKESKGYSWIWTAENLLAVVNADRSDGWTDYDMTDLEESFEEVVAWLPELSIEEVPKVSMFDERSDIPPDELEAIRKKLIPTMWERKLGDMPLDTEEIMRNFEATRNLT